MATTKCDPEEPCDESQHHFLVGRKGQNLSAISLFQLVTLILLDSRLHTPMYVFLSHLSLMDFAYSTGVTPKVTHPRAGGAGGATGGHAWSWARREQEQGTPASGRPPSHLWPAPPTGQSPPQAASKGGGLRERQPAGQTHLRAESRWAALGMHNFWYGVQIFDCF